MIYLIETRSCAGAISEWTTTQLQLCSKFAAWHPWDFISYCEPVVIRFNFASFDTSALERRFLLKSMSSHFQYAPHSSDHASSMATLNPDKDLRAVVHVHWPEACGVECLPSKLTLLLQCHHCTKHTYKSNREQHTCMDLCSVFLRVYICAGYPTSSNLLGMLPYSRACNLRPAILQQSSMAHMHYGTCWYVCMEKMPETIRIMQPWLKCLSFMLP